jgi:hypothetical protein
MNTMVGKISSIDGKLLKKTRIKIAIVICNFVARLLNIKMRLEIKE